MCSIKPIQDRVILVKPEAEEVRESGIIIPIMYQDSEEYEVVAVGPGRYGNDGLQIPMSVAVGDHVLCNRYQVQEIKLPTEQKMYYACRDDGESIRAIL